MTDQEIIDGYLDGSSSAFATISSWIRVVLRSAELDIRIDQDQIFSDATLALLVSLRAGRFRFQSSLKTYVQRIVRKLVAGEWRRLERERRLLIAENLPIDDPPDPASELIKKEERVLADRAFRLLGEKCQKLLRLWNERIPYKELAAAMDMNPGALRVQTLRCRNQWEEFIQRLKGPR